MRRRLLILLALLASAGLVACGEEEESGDGNAFQEDEFGITFDHPSGFERLTDVSVSQTAGSEAEARAGRGLDPQNGIFVFKYDLNVEVTEENLARAKAEFDGLIRSLAGRPVSGRATEVGGLPALRYPPIPVKQPANATNQLTAVFDGKTEYLLNCQSVPSKRSRIDAACRMMHATLALK